MFVQGIGEVLRIVAAEVGAASTTGYADYHYTNIPSSGAAVRACLLGGTASSGALAGLVSSYSVIAPGYATTDVGSRLCYIPDLS